MTPPQRHGLRARTPLATLALTLFVGLAYLCVSFPVYWVGLLLILLFAVMLQWLPPSGYGRPVYLLLPALALVATNYARYAPYTWLSLFAVEPVISWLRRRRRPTRRRAGR